MVSREFVVEMYFANKHIFKKKPGKFALLCIVGFSSVPIHGVSHYIKLGFNEKSFLSMKKNSECRLSGW